MILLLLLTLLLIYNSIGIGLVVEKALSRLFRVQLSFDLLALLLAGLIGSAVYFNLVSFFVAVNYLTLIPLFILATLVYLRQANFSRVKYGFVHNSKFFLQPSHIIYSIALAVVLYVYWLVPAINIDSAGYHYLAIKWYEEYKVVPGLGNVHGRYAFNPISFIISAAYSFTDVFGQSIYPLNGLLGGAFFFWLLKKILRSGYSLFTVVLLAMMVYFQRPMFANIPSPSSEPLMIVCLGYAVFLLLDVTKARPIPIAGIVLPFVLVLFSITAKLSAVPALLFIPAIFFFLPRQQRNVRLVLNFVMIAIVLWLPWLTRNVIMSGYPLFPLPYLNIFNFDWKVPHDVVLLDYTLVKYFPNFFPHELQALKAMSFFEWLSVWIPAHFYYGRQLDLVVLLSALLSPLYWFLSAKKESLLKQPIFWLWVVAYINVWVWLANSPEYRFGVVYHAFAFGLPILFALQRAVTIRYVKYVLPVAVCLISLYYSVHILKKETTYTFALKDYWLYPLKDGRYVNSSNDISTYEYTVLNNGVKLYYEEGRNECINAPLPCMPWRYGEIEMRGKDMDDGFRNIKDEVRKYYPFLNDGYKFNMHQ